MGKSQPWHIYRFAMKVGFAAICSGSIVNGLKQFLCPVGYWRFPVLGVVDQVLREHSFNSPWILDIGSPKLLSIYLAAKYRGVVHATDIQDKNIFGRYAAEFKSYNSTFGASGDYRVSLQDARQLEFDNNTFDIVYSLSVIEHIPNGGDSKAMTEIERVLKPGGLAIIEVPYASECYNTFTEESVYEREYNGQPLFYQRHYDDESLQQRLISASCLVLLWKRYFAERLPFEHYWGKIPDLCKVPFLWMEAIISAINHVQFTGFQAMHLYVRKHCGANAILLLQKPNK
ncbi:class I SAM-dependent methyltransferase [Candidatus Poribacteria bacterium]|nr:class I SAM-dependent methyltransferase [Candidatus Poribacteria bacterium]